MDVFFADGVIQFLGLVIIPLVLYINGIKSRHGMTIIVTIGSMYTFVTLLMGHMLCALVYTFFIFAYVVYRADKYVDEMKSHKFTYDKFKNYIDLDFSDIEEIFTNIFGESEQIDSKKKYEKEFNKYFYNQQHNHSYSSQRFTNNNDWQRKQTNQNSASGAADTSTKTQKDEGDINHEAVINGLRYYAKCMTVDDAKKAYRKYAVTFHPDNPVTGDEEKFIEIDKQYNKFVEIFGGR